MTAASRVILCATDLSPVGDRVAAVAYALAGKAAVVHLLYVIEPDALANMASGGDPRNGASPTAPEVVERRALDHLRRLVPRDAAARGVKTEALVLHGGDVAARIAEHASALGADTIVMGTHGRTGFGRTLLGPVAADIIRRQTPPVVFVRDRGTP